MRPGNAGANSAADHIEVLEEALAALDGLLGGPESLVVRADSAGSSYEFLDYACQAGVGFMVNVRVGRFADAVRAAHENPETVWTAAVRQNGEARQGAAVVELTEAVDLSGFPDRTRLIVRREPRHPGAQLTFEDIDGQRFTAFVTDQPDQDLAELDRLMRAHAGVEDRIRDQKQTGWGRLPSHDFAINTIWCQLAMIAANLLVWLGALGLDEHDPLRRAQPATLRYRLLHVAGKLTRSGRRTRLQLDRDWPWADQIVGLYRRLWALPTPA